MASDRQITLYYSTGSTCSQKARIALEEKQVKHELVYVDIHAGNQQVEPWFLRLNPAGVVPVLKDGDKVVVESEVVVDYIDKEFPGDLRLVPDESTEEGQEVSRWRKVAGEEAPIAVMTFGVLMNPELSVTGLEVPGYAFADKQQLMASIDEHVMKCTQYAAENPELAEAYAPRIASRRQKAEFITNKDNAVKGLQANEAIMDKFEAKMVEVNADPSSGRWLCGGGFSAADITLAVLLNRLDFLGIAARYHSNQKRPRLHAYWMQAKLRPSIYKCCVSITDILKQNVPSRAR